MELTERIKHTRDALGRTVRLRRRELGLSQEELAARAGLDQAYISHVEAARRNISVDNLVRLAEALDMSVAALFEKQS
jgi:transcriptional regulator with XRE-family HTH domain